jgi:hypothetical protein
VHEFPKYPSSQPYKQRPEFMLQFPDTCKYACPNKCAGSVCDQLELVLMFAPECEDLKLTLHPIKNMKKNNKLLTKYAGNLTV